MLHLFDNKQQNSHILKGFPAVSPKPIILFEWALFLRWHKLRSVLGGFHGVHRYFSIHVFIIFDVPTGWDESWWTLSIFLPQNRLWKLLIIKIRKFPPFFHFSIIGLPPVSSSTLGSPHPFIHLSIQVVGNDFCWPNFIRGIFLKSTAPRWGETFHSKWEKTKEPTETGDPHYCRYDGLWPSFTGVKTMAYLRYLEIHSWSSCFVSGQVNDLVMTFLPHQSHQSLFVTYKAWYQLKPWPWTN